MACCFAFRGLRPNTSFSTDLSPHSAHGAVHEFLLPLVGRSNLTNLAAEHKGAHRLGGRSLLSCDLGDEVRRVLRRDDTFAQVRALAQAAGLPASSTSFAFAHAVKEIGASRVAVAATYPDDVAGRFSDFLKASGTEVVQEKASGIITAAALKLSPQPQNIATAFLQVSSPAAAPDLLAMLWDQAGEVVSAFELIAGTGLDMLAETYPDTRQPFDTPPEWSVLVEIGTGASTDATEILETLYMLAHEKGLTGDGIIASSGQQRDAFWTARETMPAANKAIGSIASHDISVPLSELPGFIDAADTAINKLGTFRINAFGHLGDGNLHYNIFPPKGRSRDDYRNLSPQITRIVHDLTDERGGSVSAEHGLGRLKPDELKRYGDPTKIALMRQIKATLDPNGIMNPGAVLPEG